VRTLHFSDIHISPAKWPEHSRKILSFILSKVKEVRPDYVFNWGDFFDALNPDDNTIVWVRDWVKEMCKLTTFAGVTGTPAHDSPGCYHSWGPLGYTNLELGKPYRFKDLLVFGIPELTKKHLQGVTSVKSGNEQYNILLSDVIKNRIAPQRAAYPDLPCIVGLHGEVIDSEATEHNRISSGKKIRTGDLAEIGATAYIGGHIHIPWRSEKIPFEYCGSTGQDSRPWNNAGFQPHMIRVDINDLQETEWSYIDYPVMAKEKLILKGSTPLYSPLLPPDNTHLWVEYHAEEAEEVPQGEIIKHFQGLGFPKIRFTVKTAPRETDHSPITAENPTPLDYALAINPDLSPEQQNIVKSICRRSGSDRDSRVIDFRESEYNGLSLLKAPRGVFSPPGEPGLYRIKGPTGSGKSTITGSCYPLPGVIKQPDSGRKSAYHCFFKGEDAFLNKTFDINGETVKVEALIDPGKKTEYKITGHALELNTSNYNEAVEKLSVVFGQEEILLNSVFQVQPGERTDISPSLSMCSKTELRGVFLSLLGLSRKAELERVRGKIKEIKNKINSLETEEDLKIKDMNRYIQEKKKIVETLAKYPNIEEALYKNQRNKEWRDSLSGQLEDLRRKGQALGRLDIRLDALPQRKCPRCGYLPEEAAKEIEVINRANPRLKLQLENLRRDYSRMSKELENIRLIPGDIEDNLRRGAGFITAFDTETLRIEERLGVIKPHLKTLKAELENWETVYPLFQETGIPSREIEHNKGFIEQAINEKLNIFEEGRFRARIELVNARGKDDFNIMIYDSKTEREAPFNRFSGGERQIIGVVIREGAVKAAEDFQGLKYLYRVVDEGDAGISPEYINQYYDILRSAAQEGRRVFVITHNVQDDNLFDGVIEI
jgi:DNA repair exonuclease SbcCD nuclease subunit